jgi:hypothetical protein
MAFGQHRAPAARLVQLVRLKQCPPACFSSGRGAGFGHHGLGHELTNGL